MKTTEGPWYVGDGGYAVLGPGTSVAILADVNGSQIETANVLSTRVERDERIANARLIAAAPELLAAVKALVEYLPSIQKGEAGFEEVCKARAAIAKAEDGCLGRGRCSC